MTSIIEKSNLTRILSLVLVFLLFGTGFATVTFQFSAAATTNTEFSNRSNVTANLTTIAPNTVQPGTLNVGMINVTINNTGGAFDVLNWINVTVLNYTDVDAVSVWNETDGDGSFSTAGDTFLGVSGTSILSGDLGFANLTGINIGIQNSTNCSFYVVFNISASAVHGHMINASIFTFNMSMAIAGFGGINPIYPDYNTMIDDNPPTILSITTTDPDGDGKVENATIEFNEPISDASVVASRFSIGGLSCSAFSTLGTPDDNIIEIAIASEISGTEAKDVTYAYQASACTDIAGNELASVNSGDVQELDGAPPIILSAITDDSDGNGKIDRYILHFSENITAYPGFYSEIVVTGYKVDVDNSYQSGSDEVTVALMEGLDFDTGATPDITYPLGSGSLVDFSGPKPIDIANGDLNNDTNPDIVIMNARSRSITVFLHDGIGQFITRVDYPTGVTRGNITVGDVNNDGLNDVVVSDFDKGEILVFLQNSTTFKLDNYISYTSGDGALGVAIGDVNNDNKNDVVVANYYEDEIAVFIQDGTGGLNPPIYYMAGRGPTDVVIADIAKTENYGYVLYDVVVTNYLDDSITPYRQTTGGTLTTLTSILTPEGPTGIAAGDLNGDGWMDVAIACRNANYTTVIQQYASSWSSASLSGSYRYDFEVDIGTTDIAIIDANNDGSNDIITTNPGNNSVAFMLQYGSGNFYLGWKKTLNGTPHGLIVGDFNLDGRFDAATTIPSENNFTVLLQKPDILDFDTRQDIYLGSNVRSYDTRAVDVGDINNDGYNDIVVANYYVNKISILYGQPAGGFRDKVEYSTYDSNWWYPWDVKIGDLNNDGLNDVGVVIYNRNYLAVYYQNRNGKLDDPVYHGTGSNPRRLAIGDVDNDGLNDVVVTDYSSQTISVYIQNDVTGLLNSRIPYSTGINYPWGVAIGEVSGDNRNDVVVTHYYGDSSNYHMVRFKQKGDGTLDIPEKFQWDNYRYRYMYDVEIGDMNNDGKNDIITGLQNDYYIGVWYQNVAKSFGMATTYYQPFASYYDIEVEDINEDGKKDIIAASYNNNMVTILGQTQSGFNELGSYSVGSAPHGIAVDDINSDGRPDIVTANYGADSVSILKQNPTNHAYNIAVFNATQDSPWKLAKGDVNNDGLEDVALISQGWPYYLSLFHQTSMGVFGTRVDYTLDYYPYSIDVGDVNNDGREDVVVGDEYNSIIVFTQRNDGTLNNFIRYYCPNTPYSLAIGDLNSDGRNDVGVGAYYYFYRYLQTTTGTLSSYDSYYISGASNIRNIAIGDINNDSRDDVVMTEYSDDYLHYYTQTLTGGMSGYYTLSTSDAPVDVGIGDFNNDGLNDIVNTNYGSFDTISVFTQRSSGGFNSANTYSTNSNPWGLDVVDYNNDGLMDVVVADYGASTISLFTQNKYGYLNTKESYNVYSNPRFIRAHDFDNDNIVEIVTSHQSYDYIHTIYPEKTIGTNSSLDNYRLGINSLQQVTTGDVSEQDGADPVFALAITGDLSNGNSSVYNKLLVRCSEDINGTTVDNTDFTITGGITITTAVEVTPGNILLDTSTMSSSDKPTVSLVGVIKDVNDITIPLRSRPAKDGLRPKPVSAMTMDVDLNGQIDKYVITSDEDIIGTFNGSGFSVAGYSIDIANSSQTGSNELTLGLVEKSSYDTGLTPNILYTPGDLRDYSGNYLADFSTLVESDGSPPAVADMYVYRLYEDHPNLYSPNNTILIYNNTPVGLDAFFQVRVEASDNGRLAYAQGEDAFGNTSVTDTTENTGGTAWEYALNYTINQGEYKNPGINITVFDLDNNNATDYFEVILDITPPTTTMYTELGVRYVAAFTTITLTAVDSTDIYVTKYQVDSDPWVDYSGPFTLSAYSSGEHTLKYYSIDMVNNTENVNTQQVYIAEDWTGGVPSFGTYQDIVILGCNLTIDGNLIFENVTLLINNTSTMYPQWINVTSTGRFIVRNSTITSVSSIYRTRFLMIGELVMYNTTVSELWSEPGTNIGGLEIHNDSANIDQCTFHNASGSAIYINASNPSITNTTISNAYYGIVASNSAPIINQNHIMNAYTGIKIMNNSDAIILEANTIEYVNIGIHCLDVFSADKDIRITNNEFRNVVTRSITIMDSYLATSQLEIDNNTFENIAGGIWVSGMNGPDVIIRDNTIKNLTGINVGIYSNGNDIVYIEHNDFTNTFGDAISVINNSNKVYITNNNVNGGVGILTTDTIISVSNGQGQIYINNNDIQGISNIDGIATWGNENSTMIYVNDNQLHNNGIGGIWFYEYADLIYVERNVIDNNNYAIWAEHIEEDIGDIIYIRNNTVRNNTGVGISIEDINDIVIENNLVYRTSGIGIELYDMVWGTLDINNNELIENTNYGLYLKDSSINLGQSVQNNTFINNQNGGAALYTDFNPGTWHIYDQSVFINNYPYFNGQYPNLEIHNNGNLSIASTQLDWINDITVQQGGMLYAYDTVFSGPSYYDFNVFGDLYLSTCVVEFAEEMYIEDPGYIYMPATTFRNCNSNGLHLKNANLTLSNLRFQNNNGNGLFIEDCNPIVKLSEFRSNSNHGIYAENFNGNITECEFLYNNNDNLHLRDSGGEVFYNFIFQANDDNIELVYSDTTIEKNAIWYADDYGIYLDHSNAHILKNDPTYAYRVRYNNWGNYDCYIRDSASDGIYVYYSNPHIENNTIWSSDKSGISVIYSGGHIEYNEIAWNTGNGIGEFATNNPSIHDNYLHDNGDSPPNRAPSATGGNILPMYPIYTSTLRITPVGWYDPDGDPPGFLYQWQKKVSSVWTNIAGATGSTLTGGIFGGDEIRCRLTPWDGKTTGPQVNSSSVILNNSAPSITSASISPSPAYDNSALTAVPNGFSDPDQDTSQVYYYQWYNQSGLLSGATSATLPPSYFKANDTIYCMVTPSDGKDNGTTVKSISVLIIHYVDPGQTVADYDGDGVPDAQDAFPYDINEWRDTDLDGKGDNSDPDIDGDGKNNTVDAFDYDKYEWKDSDSDGVGDNTDQDDDNDGYLDSQDAFPFNASEWRDLDLDNIGDNSDPDIDGDGVNNSLDAFPYNRFEVKDSDSDGVGDNTDQDDDDDGYYDLFDAFPLDPNEHRDTDFDRIGDNADTDDDGDGYLDDWEAFLGSDNKSYSSKPLDTDSDGKPDGDTSNSKVWMDIDDDADGFNDTDEIANNTDPKDPQSYPGMPNRPPSITKVSISPTPPYDNSILTAVPEGFSDPDGDTTQVYYYQWYVNSVLVANVSTSYITPSDFAANDTVYCIVTPSDGEDNGTAVKSNVVLIIHYVQSGDKPKDYDGDGVIDSQDAFPYDKNEWRDTDFDGIGDNSDQDIDGDGKNNTIDAFDFDKYEWIDSDSDGIGDNTDQDDDNDGYYDVNDDFPLDPTEHLDNDKDGTGDNADTDDDNDGFLDTWEIFLGTDYRSHSSQPLDTDSDGIPNGDSTNSQGWMDTDDDADGHSDSAEKTAGTDPLDPNSYPGAPNRAPSITKVTINPSPAYDNSMLTAVPEGFNDPDGDTTQIYYYQWYINGLKKAGQTNSYLSPNSFMANDTIFCMVTPSDGTDNGTAVKSNIVLIIHYTEPGQEPKDYDGDNVTDDQDAFPFDPKEWRDTDGDGIGDNSDTDIDGDGYTNDEEIAAGSNPFNDNSIPGDIDGDGTLDINDLDIDGDNVDNNEDDFPYDRTETKDSDSDGVGDNADQDDDNDGYLDSQDDFPFDPNEWRDTDGDGIGDNADTDIDGDGVNNVDDDFPDDRTESKDTDGDGIGDNTDKDIDGDGVTNEQDDFPIDPNEWRDTDGDGEGDNSDNDIDGDGIDNDKDEFPDEKGDWVDTDGDGFGDNTDSDDDNDNYTDDRDDFPKDKNEWKDTDGDGEGDNSDDDVDGDGTKNQFDKFPRNKDEWSDNDNDGIGDNIDPDDDNDKYMDINDAFPFDETEWRDTDFDGTGDNSDDDIDGDGKDNELDAFDYDRYEWLDSDDDGIGDNTDQDDDNDGYYDVNDDFPLDPNEHEKPIEKEEKETDKSAGDDGIDQGLLTLIIIMIVVLLVMAFMYMKMTKQLGGGKAEEIAPEPKQSDKIKEQIKGKSKTNTQDRQSNTGKRSTSGTRIGDIDLQKTTSQIKKPSKIKQPKSGRNE